MPNWCDTTYLFKGNSDDINRFYEQLNDWTTKFGVSNGFGHEWLGNILLHAGLNECMEGTSDSYISHCGSVDWIDDYVKKFGDQISGFYLSTQTAWRPMPKIFDKVIKKYNYDITFAFKTEEDGMNIYEIYDPNNWQCFDDENLIINYWFKNEDCVLERYPFLNSIIDNRFWNKDTFKEWISENGFKSISEFNNLKLDNENDYLCAYEYEYIDDYS